MQRRREANAHNTDLFGRISIINKIINGSAKYKKSEITSDNSLQLSQKPVEKNKQSFTEDI